MLKALGYRDEILAGTLFIKWCRSNVHFTQKGFEWAGLQTTNLHSTHSMHSTTAKKGLRVNY
jgi:hypothetical protein